MWNFNYNANRFFASPISPRWRLDFLVHMNYFTEFRSFTFLYLFYCGLANAPDDAAYIAGDTFENDILGIYAFAVNTAPQVISIYSIHFISRLGRQF